MRVYVAFCESGHYFFNFEYKSNYKVNSYKNLHDAYIHYFKKYGYRDFKVYDRKRIK